MAAVSVDGEYVKLCNYSDIILSNRYCKRSCN